MNDPQKATTGSSAASDLDVDSETRTAIAALVYRLKNRPPDDDDELFALEFMTALRGNGWRPTRARPAPPWQTTSTPATAEARKAAVDEYVRGTDWYRRAHPEGGDHDDPA